MTQTYPNRLRSLRLAHGGLTVEHLAIELGLTAETIERWERGYYEIPTRYARALAKRFSVSISHLLCDDYQEQAA